MPRRILFVVVGLIIVGSYMSLYRISHIQCAVKMRGNQILADSKDHRLQKAGVYFKVPFLDTVIRWDTRLQHAILRSMPLITTEDITVHVDYQINWRIQNPNSYVAYRLNPSFDTHHLFLNWINEYLEVNWQQKPLTALLENQFEELKEGFLKRAKELGIEVVDFRAMQKIPSSQSKKSILTQMKEHQLKAVDSTIKRAKTQAAFIEEQAKSSYAKSLAEAKEKAAVIEQEGELEAMQLYTDAYSKNSKFADIYQQMISEINSLSSRNTQLMFIQIASPFAESA